MEVDLIIALINLLKLIHVAFKVSCVKYLIRFVNVQLA